MITLPLPGDKSTIWGLSVGCVDTWQWLFLSWPWEIQVHASITWSHRCDCVALPMILLVKSRDRWRSTINSQIVNFAFPNIKTSHKVYVVCFVCVRACVCVWFARAYVSAPLNKDNNMFPTDFLVTKFSVVSLLNSWPSTCCSWIHDFHQYP